MQHWITETTDIKADSLYRIILQSGENIWWRVTGTELIDMINNDKRVISWQLAAEQTYYIPTCTT